MSQQQENQMNDSLIDDSNVNDAPPQEIVASQDEKQTDHTDDVAKGKTPHSHSFQQFLDSLKEVKEPEKKLESAINYMEVTLSQSGSPHFKDFWEAKKLATDIFKEHINPTQRVTLWAKYSELCREARRLKEIFDEQSAFACEQIEIAVKAIEDEIQAISEKLSKTPPLKFAAKTRTVERNFENYNVRQKELNFLNVYATKVNSLRKELMKTEMRIRFKNKFFLRLSHLGDLIFPKRKTLIQEVSDLFRQDVEKFIEDTFSGELRMTELFQVREEIKALQGVAKELTLNTEVFSHTRKKLSECWDSIKNQIHERKEAEHGQKEIYKQERDEFLKEIEELKKKCEEKTSTREKLELELEAIVSKMRKATLGRQEIQILREKVREIRQYIFDQFKSAEELQREEALVAEQNKLEKFKALEKTTTDLIRKVESLELEALLAAFDEVTKEISLFPASRQQKLDLDKKLRVLRDHVAEKKENKLLELSPDDKLAIEQLQVVLKERKERREEIKNRLEHFRKTQSSSSRGFALALETNTELEEEKERLAKIEASIFEVQDKIRKLKSLAKGS
jgi:hypothetical protein